MLPTTSVRFFDEQFQRQAGEGSPPELNPFEQVVLPHLRGRLLDLGCGLGALSLAAARRGCRVLALDGSPTAVAELQRRAAEQSLPVQVQLADLRHLEVPGPFDAVACIGLLMFFDAATAQRHLARLRDLVEPGGVVALNVLVEGTTFMDMFDPAGWCLLAPGELGRGFTGWAVLHHAVQDFPAPRGLLKRFETLVVRRPG